MSDTPADPWIIAERLATGLLERKVKDLANPFDAMPDAEWTRAVTYFAATRARLVPSPASLCLRLLYWISKGLTLADAKAVFRRLCDPEVACNHRFPEQLDADLAGLVASALRRRRMIAEQKRLREEFPNARLKAEASARRSQPESLGDILDRTSPA